MRRILGPFQKKCDLCFSSFSEVDAVCFVCRDYPFECSDLDDTAESLNCDVWQLSLGFAVCSEGR